jgi:hypothetical protein
MNITDKMVTIEFYMLFDDKTWDTDFIAIPESVFKTGNHDKMVEWVTLNEKFSDNVELIGVYCDNHFYEDDDE